MDDDLHSTVAALLRRVDQRYTRGRRELAEALAAASRPVTAAELVASLPSMPQSTAYRNLAVLSQAGAVHRVAGNDEYVRYELAESLTGRHHHHLVCVSCGVVEDFAAPLPFERRLASLMGTVTTDTGFQADTHRLDLLGTCAACGA